MLQALGIRRETLGKDLLASLVVFLVALPLCMGIAIASGAPPAAGLITGIVGGLVVGFIAGSPLQVSGPAAGLTVLVYEIIHTHGIGMLGAIVLLAGILQVAAGFLRVGAWFRAISPAVIQGMLAGIGVLIIGSQIHVMVDTRPKGSGLQNLLAIPETIWRALTPADGLTHHLAGTIGLLTIAAIVAWGFAPKRLRVVPAALVGIVVATLANWALGWPIQLIALPDNLAAAISWPTAGALARLLETPIITAAVTIAVVASAETMLTATAIDAMHNGPRTKHDKELVAQGIGNAICGALGALPMTGVIVRSSANVQAGAQTRLSTILHGAWILLLVAFLPFLLTRIPTTALAALLVFTGFKLLSPKTIVGLWKHGRGEALVYMVTLVAIVATNLLEGILIGLAFALVKQLRTLSKLEIKRRTDPETGEDHLHLRGAATFVVLPKLAAALEKAPASKTVHVDVSELVYIDHACLNMMAEWEKNHAASGGHLVMEWETLRLRAGQQEPAKEEKISLSIPR